MAFFSNWFKKKVPAQPVQRPVTPSIDIEALKNALVARTGNASKIRYQHYHFAQALLPAKLFEDTRAFAASLEKAGTSYLRSLWKLAANNASSLPPEQAAKFSLESIAPEAIKSKKIPLNDAVSLHLIEMPPPKAMTEAHMIGIVMGQHGCDPVRYLILEFSAGMNVVGERGKNGMRYLVDFLPPSESPLETQFVDFVKTNLKSVGQL